MKVIFYVKNNTIYPISEDTLDIPTSFSYNELSKYTHYLTHYGYICELKTLSSI